MGVCCNNTLSQGLVQEPSTIETLGRLVSLCQSDQNIIGWHKEFCGFFLRCETGEIEKSGKCNVFENETNACRMKYLSWTFPHKDGQGLQGPGFHIGRLVFCKSQQDWGEEMPVVLHQVRLLE